MYGSNETLFSTCCAQHRSVLLHNHIAQPKSWKLGSRACTSRDWQQSFRIFRNFENRYFPFSKSSNFFEKYDTISRFYVLIIILEIDRANKLAELISRHARNNWFHLSVITVFNSISLIGRCACTRALYFR